jgi:hypothetical protein
MFCWKLSWSTGLIFTVTLVDAVAEVAVLPTTGPLGLPDFFGCRTHRPTTAVPRR